MPKKALACRTAKRWIIWTTGCVADGQWLYYGVEEENFFLIQWYPDEAAANAKLAQLEELGDGKQYLVDLSLKRENPSSAEKTSAIPIRSSSAPENITLKRKEILQHAAF